MHGGVAVGTNRTQVTNRVNLANVHDAGQRSQVVDMYQARDFRSILIGRVETANDAARTEVGNALGSSCRAALEGVDYHSERGPLKIGVIRYFVRPLHIRSLSSLARVGQEIGVATFRDQIEQPTKESRYHPDVSRNYDLQRVSPDASMKTLPAKAIRSVLLAGRVRPTKHAVCPGLFDCANLSVRVRSILRKEYAVVFAVALPVDQKHMDQ